MKNRKHYFVAEFATDLLRDDETEIFYAPSVEAVEREIKETLGEHLLAVYVRKATWAERRRMRKTHYQACIVA